MCRQGAVQQMAWWLTTRIINYALLLVPEHTAENASSVKDEHFRWMTVWHCLWNSLQDFWSVLMSKSKPYYFYSHFPSSTFRLARKMNFPPPPPITDPIIAASKVMVKSAHHSFPGSSRWLLKGKHNNLSHRTSSNFPPSVPEMCVSWVQTLKSGTTLPPLSPLVFVMWLTEQLKTVIPFQNTGCNSSPYLF